jgi:hypothetical protein
MNEDDDSAEDDSLNGGVSADDAEGREDQYPEVGDIQNGKILVCMGDYRPDRWESWLQDAVQEFEALAELGQEFGLQCVAGTSGPVLHGWRDFCEAVGVSFDCDFWEGDHISGHWHMGWVEERSLKKVQRTTERLLGSVRRRLDRQVRAAVLEELREVQDLEQFVERTRDDRRVLRTQCKELQCRVSDARRTIDGLQATIEMVKREACSSLMEDCLILACAVLRGSKDPMLAGPLALWTDGVVYALVDRGGVRLPEESAPWKLILALEQGGHPVVRVTEMTLLGGWISGPIYRRGSSDIAGWSTAWQDQERKPRNFLVEPPERIAVVDQVHAHFKELLPKPADH